MTTDGETLSFSYDKLKRLKGRTAPVLNTEYTYRDRSSTLTTTQISGITYKKVSTGAAAVPQFGYAYDTRGNITNNLQGVAAETYTMEYGNAS